jgi:hypothetical protein
MFGWIQPGEKAKINPVKFRLTDMEGYTPEMRFSIICLIKEEREMHDYSPVLLRCIDDGELYVMPVMDIMPENGWLKK